jgi:hypothetical protein
MDRAIPSLALIAAALLVAACAPATRYQGVSLAAGGADPEIQSLASRAATGDKWAQLELGIRFEEGRGVPMDWRRAARLYRAASRTTGGTIMVYMPPVRRGGTGSVMPVSTGPRMPGLPEARARLDALRKRRQAEGSPRRI